MSLTEFRTRAWHDDFSDAELEALRTFMPRAIHSAQARSASAYTAYDDLGEGRHVYGAGMLRGVIRDARELLRPLSTYRELPIPHSSRKLMFVGSKMIFPIRVGERMRRNINRLYLNSFSDARRDQLGSASSQRDTHTPLFDVLTDEDEITTDATLADVVEQLGSSGNTVELFVVFFSSDHRGVGQIYWAPARLEGRYLTFLNPEAMSYAKRPAQASTADTALRPVAGFADVERPKTSVRRRKRPIAPTSI